MSGPPVDAPAPGAGAATAAPDGPDAPRSWPPSRRPAVAVTLALVLLAIPLAVALGALRAPHWYPPGDLAQTEMRVRDVTTSHPPLIGLPGRIGRFGEQQGSHPGPLSFYALWPGYRLLGSSSWAFQASAVLLHLAAFGAVLWMAHRRGGVALVLAFAALLAMLTRYYGAHVLAEPWNPYLPVSWWLVFLVAVWSVLAGDVALLPIAAFAGSFCAQTHVPYTGSTVVLGAVATGAAVRMARRAADPQARRAVLRWVAVAAGVAVAVWLPPVVEQFTTERGNLTVIWEHFTDPPEDAIGFGRGLEHLLIHLDPVRLATQRWRAQLPREGDAILPGVLLLAAWAAAMVARRRRTLPPLRRLDLLLGVALVVALLSLSRIFGNVYPYLMLWVWGINLLLVLDVGWTAAALARERLGGPPRQRQARTAGAAALAAVAVASSAWFAADARDLGIPTADLSRTMVEVVPATVEALSRPDAPGGGRDGRYLLTWVDPFALNGRGFGLLLELEKQGFTVGTERVHRNAARAHRLMDRADATAELHLSVGPDIEAWRARPDVDELLLIDVRSPAERREYDALRAEVADGLHRAGLDDLVEEIDGNLFAAVFDDRVPRALRPRVQQLMDLSMYLPTAIFVGPPERA